MTCHACGGALPADARFCPSCGAPATGPAVERRLVTVLFSDLVGSTSLAERLDPEVLDAIMGAYHDLARRAIERNGGTVAASQGDGAIGMFGLPTAHEDDAARAARAGLDLIGGLAQSGRGYAPRCSVRLWRLTFWETVCAMHSIRGTTRRSCSTPKRVARRDPISHTPDPMGNCDCVVCCHFGLRFVLHGAS